MKSSLIPQLNLLDLPSDVIEKIFTYLAVDDLFTLTGVNKPLLTGKHELREISFWKNIGNNIKTREEFIISKLKGTAQFLLDHCSVDHPINIVYFDIADNSHNSRSVKMLKTMFALDNNRFVSLEASNVHVMESINREINIQTPNRSLKILIRNFEEAKQIARNQADNHLVYMIYFNTNVPSETEKQKYFEIEQLMINAKKSERKKIILMAGLFDGHQNKIETVQNQLIRSTENREKFRDYPMIRFSRTETPFTEQFFNALTTLANLHNSSEERRENIASLKPKT